MKIPGLIDLQVNGFKGVDFSDAQLGVESFTTACRQILASGTSAFLPTVVTSSPKVYRHNLPLIANVLNQEEFAGRLLGIHLEGPFISPADGARGAHDGRWVRDADIEYLRQLLDWAGAQVRLLTVAAEVDGIEKLIEYAASEGITVSLGHQMADATAINRAAAAGACALTHLGNGVPAVLDRHKNPIWAGLANDDVSAMIITDGHHLPDSVIKTFIRAKGIERIIITSDASPIAGLLPGRYETLNNAVVLDESGRLYNPQTGYMVGSSTTMLDCMNYLASLRILTVEQLIRVGFDNPLKLIGVEPSALRPMREILFDEEMALFTPAQAG